MTNLVCPSCITPLIKEDDNSFVCKKCSTNYPSYHGIPILINESNSIFKISDFTSEKDLFFKKRTSRLNKIYNLFPKRGVNWVASKNTKEVLKLLGDDKKNILIIGGGILGKGNG